MGLLIFGDSVMWTNGTLPSNLKRTHRSNKVSVELMGLRRTGELTNANQEGTKIVWNDNEIWSLKRRCNGMTIIPNSFGIKQRPQVRNPQRAMRALLEAFDISSAEVSDTSLLPFLDCRISSLGLNDTELFVARELISRHFGETLPAHFLLHIETIGDL